MHVCYVVVEFLFSGEIYLAVRSIQTSRYNKLNREFVKNLLYAL